MRIQNSEFRIQSAIGRRLDSGWLLLALLLSAALAVLPMAQLQVLLGIILLGGVVLAIIAEPTIGVALTIVAGPLGPLEREILHVLPLDSAQLLLALTLFAYVLRMLRHPFTREASPPHPLIPFTPFIPLALLFFLAVALLSFFQARDASDWSAEVLKWVEMLVLCVLVSRERDPRKVAFLIGAVLFSAAVQGAMGLWQYFRGYGPAVFVVPGTNYYRSYGTFQQPNPFGGYVGLIWPFCAGVVLALIRKWRLEIKDWRLEICLISNLQSLISLLWLTLALAATALALSGVFTSGSRGARLAAGAALVVMGLSVLPRRKLWLSLVGLIGLAAVAFNQIPASLTDTITGLVNDYGALDVRGIYLTAQNFSNVERLAHWQVAVDMMRDHPWLGVGFGNYGAYYEQYRLLYWVNALGHAHNYYLNIFAETGAIGFVAYLTVWVTIFGVTIGRSQTSAQRVKHQTPLVNRQWSTANSQPQFSILNSKFLYIGLLGTWTHLTVHHLFDNLYVANSFLLIGVLLGVLINRRGLSKYTL